MDMHETVTYPASADAVFAMLTDAAYWRDVAAAMHALHEDVDVRHDGTDIVVHIRRTMPARVPDVARALVGSEIEIEQTEYWSSADRDGRRAARLLLTIPGKPVRFPARMTLEDVGASCRQSVSGRIEVRLPFGGGAIAAEVAKAIRAGMRVQEQVGRHYLLRSPDAD